MKKLLLILVCIIPLSSIAQDNKIFFDKNWDKSSKDSAFYYRISEKFNDSLYIVKDYFISGVLQMETKSTETIKLKKYGLTTFFHENGKKSSEGEYFSNNKIGEWKGWYKDGALKSSENYNNNGKLTGKASFWYENGQLEVEYLYNEGKIIKGGDKYFETGLLKMKYYYSPKGDKISTWKMFHENKNLRIEGKYKEDKKEGEWTEYYQNNKIKTSGQYLDNMKSGTWKFYDEDNNIYAEKIYSTNDCISSIFYNKNGGKIKQEGIFPPKYEHRPVGHLQEYLYEKIIIDNDSIKEGSLVIGIKIDSDGIVKTASINQGINHYIDSAFLVAFKNIPNWIPGKYNNLESTYYLDIVINFFSNNTFEIKNITYQSKIKDDIDFYDIGTGSDDLFTIVEEMPSFKGGVNEMFKYLQVNMIYPKDAKNNNISGTVFVNFTIEKTGIVSNVKILRGVNPLLDDESMRVVKKMPIWIPGYQRGIPVRVSYTLPIKFRLK